MNDALIRRLRNLEGMIPKKHKMPSGADTVICSLEFFQQIRQPGTLSEMRKATKNRNRKEE